MNQFGNISMIANVERLDFSLSKFVKYANHLAVDFIRNPELLEGDKRGENYVVELIEASYKSRILGNEERDDFYSGELNIEEIVFRILEILIYEGYFVVDDYGVKDSTNPNSFVYAWNTYIRLGKALRKGLIEIPDMYIDMGKSQLKINSRLIQEQDSELEQNTLEVIHILITGKYLSDNDAATKLDDFLNELGRKGILGESELVEAISSQDILATLAHIIENKLINTGRIQSLGTITYFHQLSNVIIGNNTQNIKNNVDGILEIDDEDDSETFDEQDEFLAHMTKGLTIIQHISDLGGELIDYDTVELISLATEYDVISSEFAQKMFELSAQGDSKKSDIIYRIFEKFYDSGYLDEIDMDEEERIQLKSHMRNVLYFLNMMNQF